MITESFRIQHRTEQTEYQKRPHFHDINQILFSLNEDSTLLLNQNTYSIQPGTLVFVPQGTLHQKHNVTQIDSFVIHYSPVLLKELSTPSTDLYAAYGETAAYLQLRGEALDMIHRQFRRFFLSESSVAGDDLKNITILLEILLEALPLMQEADSTGRGQYFRDDAQLGPILDYLDNHLTENLTLDTLSTALYTNKYTLCHLFKRKTGLTLITYINMNRVRLSCILLKNGLTVQESGRQSGFLNAEHFIRTFTTFVGTTPGKYARTLAKNRNVPIPYGIYGPTEDPSSPGTDQ